MVRHPWSCTPTHRVSVPIVRVHTRNTCIDCDADGGVVVGVSQATDSKKEAFRKFLETAGVIDMLTKCA